MVGLFKHMVQTTIVKCGHCYKSIFKIYQTCILVGSEVRISNLIVYDSDYFFECKNIIISSLLGKKLIRIKYDYQSNKVLYLENIYLGKELETSLKLMMEELLIIRCFRR